MLTLVRGLATMGLSVGAKAPAFTLNSHTGASISLGDYAGKKSVLIWFYPRASTGG